MSRNLTFIIGPLNTTHADAPSYNATSAVFAIALIRDERNALQCFADVVAEPVAHCSDMMAAIVRGEYCKTTFSQLRDVVTLEWRDMRIALHTFNREDEMSRDAFSNILTGFVAGVDHAIGIGASAAGAQLARMRDESRAALVTLHR
jgi:hypothetical protein